MGRQHPFYPLSSSLALLRLLYIVDTSGYIIILCISPLMKRAASSSLIRNWEGKKEVKKFSKEVGGGRINKLQLLSSSSFPFDKKQKINIFLLLMILLCGIKFHLTLIPSVALANVNQSSTLECSLNYTETHASASGCLLILYSVECSLMQSINN